MDVQRITELGWRAKVPLGLGVAAAYADYSARTAACFVSHH